MLLSSAGADALQERKAAEFAVRTKQSGCCTLQQDLPALLPHQNQLERAPKQETASTQRAPATAAPASEAPPRRLRRLRSAPSVVLCVFSP